MDEDEELVCTEDAYEHDLRVIDQRDGITTEECRRCGAEIMTDDETGEAV